MSSSVAEIAVPVEETEAYETLLGRAFKRTGKIATEDLVRHVLSIVPAAEWPVRVEAMDALIRRIDAGREDKLRVESRPPEGKVLGLWGTRRPGSGARPYRTVIMGVSPIQARCDCPDFLRNSLGVCKHGLTVLEHVFARPRLLQQAIKEQEWGEPPGREGLWWDPIRPLTGQGDWLERVSWRGETSAVAARSARACAGPALVPRTEGRRARHSRALTRATRSAAGAGRRPDQGHPGRRVGPAPRSVRASPAVAGAAASPPDG